MNKWALFLLLILSPVFAKTQALNHYNDFSILSPIKRAQFSLRNSIKDSTPLSDKVHSPKKATIYSAVLPGLGQAYNHKYWKIPLIYAGLAGSYYFMHVNRDSMLVYQNALKLLLDTNRNTNPVAYYRNQPITQLRATRNLHRTNRDYSIIAFAGIYLINIVDAAIDAHFYNFNIDKPLAMQKTRHIYLVSGRVQSVPAFGLAYRF